MKKVISLALVVVLALSLATVAFAAEWDTTSAGMLPGEKYKLNPVDFAKLVAPSHTTVPAAGTVVKAYTLAPKTAYFTSEYFSLSYKVEKGANLLESVKFDGDGAIVVKFKANYELEQPSIGNFKFDSIKIKAIKEAKGDANGWSNTTTAVPAWAAAAVAITNETVTIAKGTEFEASVAASVAFGDTGYAYLVDKTVSVSASDALDLALIGYTPATSAALSTGNIVDKKVELDKDVSIKIIDKGLFKFKEKNVSYKDITIVQGDFYAEVRVFDGDKFYYEQSNTADLDIVKANPDAELSFFTFKGKPTFNSSAKIEISGDKDQFIYEIKDGKLVKTNFKWNDDSYAFTGKAVTLGSYVVSDIELKNAASADEKDDTKNPNTGANDVVGVAVALAVVSLVAAGAVSLKK